MASRDAAMRPKSPVDDGFPSPQFPGRSDAAGPPSIISSRMTDIASEAGGDDDEYKSSVNTKRGAVLSDTSRPGTGRTGPSSIRDPWRQPQLLRKNYVSGLAAKRGSAGAGSIAGSVSTRPPSSTSRSHVPSLTSHAFFHPMSSQKLQAQRGGQRPSTMSKQHQNVSEAVPGGSVGGNEPRQGVTSNDIMRFQRQFSDDGELRRPTSRGTEMTEQETLDRITANTSPTQGHHPTGSLSESVRPLQRKPIEHRNLHVDVGNSYKDRGNQPSPMKSPRSFRSSFLLPGKGENGQSSANRNLHGAEKLSSVASSPQLNPTDSQMGKRPQKAKNAKPPNLGYVFQYFEGNTVFCMGGRFQNTKHRPVNIATGLMIVIPSVLFFVFSAPWLWFNVSPAIPIVFGYMFYICISSFVHASVSDPGILPRNLHAFPPVDENDDPLRLAPPTNDWTLIKSAESATAAMEVPVKHCRTCNIWRPPRAHHCRLCDNCIETHDHHCVWINNCVGRRNYRYFVAFLTSAVLLCMLLMGACLTQILVHMNRSNISFGDSVSEFRVPFAMVIVGFLAMLYPLALLGYHIFLMARGETTREYINSHKFVKKDRFRAFTQGSMMKNWFVILCRPRPPTYYRFKSKYEQGDQRLGRPRDRRAAAAKDSQGMEMQDVHTTPGAGFQGPVALRNQSNVAEN